MTADRWREVSRIYGAVLTKPEPERAAALGSMCANDDELRREVESLLRSVQDVALIDRAATERPSTLGLLEGRAIGSQIGVFRIDALLGVGGMGEVYRARDTKLQRDVAIKILPPAFANDLERLARFKREAQVLASLNHPNIGAIHGFEDSGPVHALVLELVEGPTLADRITRGPLAVGEALTIARQIADALECAHEQGVIHRDLKPANVKVRDDGTVKVLDFGLAKMLEPTATGATPAGPLTQSPTITTPAMTAAGMILGTAAYMSPEQAKGKPADKRSDIWAFGCVLYEMLTGERAFKGEDVAETLAEVIKGAPDWTRLPAIPPAIRLLVQRCVDKDRRKRVGDASAIQLLLSEPSMLMDGPATPTPSRRSALALAAAALAGALIVAFAAWLMRARWLPYPTAPQVVRFTVSLPGSMRFTNTGRHVVAISPDGRKLAWTANGQLWVRVMNELQPRALTDVSVAVVNPVFSSDSESVAFWSGSAIRRVSVTGGTPIQLVQVPQTVYGMSWADDGILYGEVKTSALDGGTTVRRVPPSGGAPITVAESAPSETFFAPSSLPGGRGVLVTLASGIAASRWDKANIILIRPTGERRTLIEGASDGRYLPTGHLAYAMGGVVFAVPFDLNSLTVSGPATPILEGVGRGYPASGAAQYSVSKDGTLAYIAGPPTLPAGGRSLALYSLDGPTAVLDARIDQYEFPRLSPDKHQVAVGSNDGAEANVWTYVLDGKADRRRVTVGGRNRFPVWSSDGSRIAFQSDREGDRGIFWQAADGSGRAERLTTAEPGTSHIPTAWTSDGALLFEVLTDGRYSVRALSLRTRKTSPLFAGSSWSPFTPTLSPDGRWLAYHTQDSVDAAAATARPRRDSVWIRPYPITRDVFEVSSEGTSHHPLWLDGGRRLLYIIGAGQVVARDITLASSPQLGPARPLHSLVMPTQPPGDEARTFDVLGDGRLLSIANSSLRIDGGSAVTATIEVVQNWFTELRAKGIGR